MASKGTSLHGPQVRLIEQAHRLFAETKEHVFESKASEEHAKLVFEDVILHEICHVRILLLLSDIQILKNL